MPFGKETYLLFDCNDIYRGTVIPDINDSLVQDWYYFIFYMRLPLINGGYPYKSGEKPNRFPTNNRIKTTYCLMPPFIISYGSLIKNENDMLDKQENTKIFLQTFDLLFRLNL